MGRAWYHWWEAEAFNRQQDVENFERGGDYRVDDFTPHNARRAVVYTRRDVVALRSLLASANKQLATIKILLALIFVALSLIAYRL
jgi:hypothetical protein